MISNLGFTGVPTTPSSTQLFGHYLTAAHGAGRAALSVQRQCCRSYLVGTWPWVLDIARGLDSHDVKPISGISCPDSPYLRCWARNLFISNIVARFLPKMRRSLSSAMISRPSSGFCSLLALMYSHTLLTTSPRAIVPSPTTAARSGDGCNGCCRALGLLPALGFSTFVPFGGVLPFAFSAAAPSAAAFRLGGLGHAVTSVRSR